jgi:hypothetical protein
MQEYIQQILNSENTGILILALFLIVIGAMAKWRMFVKADQPGLAAIVPVWDVVVTLRMVGRPAWHIVYFLIPLFNIYFGFRLLVEIAQSFGKTTVVDYIFAIVFNMFYLLNLGLAYNEEYRGPVYGVSMEELKAREAQYAAV